MSLFITDMPQTQHSGVFSPVPVVFRHHRIVFGQAPAPAVLRRGQPQNLAQVSAQGDMAGTGFQADQEVCGHAVLDRQGRNAMAGPAAEPVEQAAAAPLDPSQYFHLRHVASFLRALVRQQEYIPSFT